MTSARQQAANRQNAQRSTGPRTTAGKARVAQNAVTHGLLSEELLLPDEDPKALQTLSQNIRAACNPRGAQEEFLVELMIRAAWRLGRLSRIEAGVFAWKRVNLLAARAYREAETHDRDAMNAFEELDGQRSTGDVVEHQAAITEATRLTTLRDQSAAATLGLTFIRGSSGVDPLGKLQRYEASAERSYYRALHELQRLQHPRLGAPVPPPLAIDIEVNDGTQGAAMPTAAIHPIIPG